MGNALADNLEGGEVIFIAPSMVDDFWKDAETVQRWFAGFGVTNVRHYPMTTQAFIATEDYSALGRVGMVFVDGYHAEEQVRFDYHAFITGFDPWLSRSSRSADGRVVRHR